MPRPRTNDPSNPSRSRATAHSFAKPTFKPPSTPPTQVEHPPTPYLQRTSSHPEEIYSEPIPTFNCPPTPYTGSQLPPGIPLPGDYDAGFANYMYFPPPPLHPASIYQTSNPGEEFVALPDPPETNPATEADSDDPQEPVRRPENQWILYRTAKFAEIKSGADVPFLQEAKEQLAKDMALQEEKDRRKAELALKRAKEEAEAQGKPWPLEESTDSKPSGKVKAKPKQSKKRNQTPVAPALLEIGTGKTGRGPPQSDLSKLVGIMWKLEPPEVREIWKQKSLEQKEAHLILHPEYHYKPRSAAQKQQDKLEKEKARETKRQARLKEREQSKPCRKPRTRTRNSPTAPYSVLSASADRAMAREIANADTGIRITPARTPVDEKSGTIYPFPIPSHAIPSMPADHSFGTLGHTEPTCSGPTALPSGPQLPPTHASNALTGQPLEHWSPDCVHPVVPRHYTDPTEAEQWNGTTVEELASTWAVLEDGEPVILAESSTYEATIPPVPVQPWMVPLPDESTPFLAPQWPFVSLSPAISQDPAALPLAYHPVDPASMHNYSGLWFDGVDLSEGDEPINLAHDADTSIFLETVVSETAASPGPLLSGNAVFSPSYLEWNLSVNSSSTSPSDSNDEGVPYSIPRDASFSSYLVTPQLDPQGPLPFSDRSASFANAEAFMGGLDDVGEDMINWVNDEDEYSSRVVSGETVIERRSISVASYPDAKQRSQQRSTVSNES